MTDLKLIYEFATKWSKNFHDEMINTSEPINQEMLKDCQALGFTLTDGSPCSDKDGESRNDYEALNKMIENITDIELLVNVIYSKLIGLNRSSARGTSLFEPKNKAWFLSALNRLENLSNSNQSIFQGTLTHISIISNNFCFGLEPLPGEDVDQHLFLTDKGHVHFSGFGYIGDNGENYQELRSKTFDIAKKESDKLFKAIASYFSHDYEEIFATDIGNWAMELTNSDGVTYTYHGSLCAEFNYQGCDLSDLVREILGIDDLYVFDGNDKPDTITRITLDYHRQIKQEEETKNYRELLIIDSKVGTIELNQFIKPDCKISHLYESADTANYILGSFNAEELFTLTKRKPKNLVDNTNNKKTYKITLDYLKAPQRTIKGDFDKMGLPTDFADFAELVFDCMNYFSLGDIFNPAIYGKKRRRQSESIFCSVTFDEGYKRYYYLTDDESIEIGDFVLVPAGEDNHETVVKVVAIEMFNKKNAPLPLEKAKHIIRKCGNDIDLIY